MKNDFLTREIIRKVFGDVGIAPPPNFGKVGISIPELQLPTDLVFAMEDGNSQNFPLWAAEVILDKDVKLRALACDLSTDGVPEYALTFQMSGKPLYGLKLIYDDDDNGVFMIGEKNGWQFANMVAKARALIGMETIMMHGLSWEPCENTTDLYEAISTIAEM